MADKLLFLSHAGVDTDAALALAERIERYGLRVWIDKRDLVAGRGWQQQLEDIIEKQSTAFAVYIGSRGVVNWVESEVRVALARATGSAYPFIPVLARGVEPATLPAFARQFQGVKDVERDPAALQELVRAASTAGDRAARALETQPFLGLSAFGEAHTHLFFGREAETEALVERLHETSLLMVVGDSGSGKSSLVMAGLVPRFRGGAFAAAGGERPDETPWHVVQMRPMGAPFEKLVNAVSESARAVGIDIKTRLALAKAIRTRDPDTIRDALREGALPKAQTLLVVDQFEELWTQSDASSRAAFIDALLGLAAPGDFTQRVVITMRRDYYNLCSQHPSLFERVNDREATERYALRRMSDVGLRECIVKPLALTDAGNVAVFADAVLRDAGDQPGELALLEMALTETWRRRGESPGNLLEAYERAGRVSGALANAAEWVFSEKLSEAEQQLAEALFMRLVRLGDTGGTTRRIASRDEFPDESWRLAQRLAQEDHKRLLFVREDSAELAHEALVTQWPRYQSWLQQTAPDKRKLDALMDHAARWARVDAPNKRKVVARGFDLENYSQLLETRASWLSEVERAFIAASAEEARQYEQQLQELYRRALGRQLAAQALRLLDDPRCTHLETATLLAVEAYRRHPTLEAQQALFGGLERFPSGVSRMVVPAAGNNPTFFVVSPTGAYVAAADGSGGFTLFDMRAAKVLRTFGFTEGPVARIAFTPDERYVAAIGYKGGRVCLWAIDSGASIAAIDMADARFAGREHLGSILFSPASDLLAVMNEYGIRVRIVRVGTDDVTADLSIGTSKSPQMAFSPDGSLFAATDEVNVTVWSTPDWKLVRKFPFSSAGGLILFSPDGRALLRIWSGSVQRWEIESGERTLDGNWSSAFTDAVFGQGPDTLAVGTTDSLLHVYATHPFIERQRFPAHGQLSRVCFDRSDRLIAAYEYPNLVRIWDLKLRMEVERYYIEAAVLHLHFSDHNLGITTGEARNSQLDVSHYVATPSCRRRRIDLPSGIVEYIALSDDGKWIACRGDSLRILSLDSGDELRHVAGAFGGLCFEPRGEFLLAAKNTLFAGGVKLVSLDGEWRDAEVSCEGVASYSRVRSSTYGGYFGVNCVSDTLRVWPRHLGERIDLKHPKFPREFEFLREDMRVATLDDTSCVRIWDIASRTETGRLVLQGSLAGDLSIHPREPILATYAANTERAVIWNYDKDEVLGACVHPGNIRGIQISPCGRWLATIGMSNNSTLLWRLPDGAPLYELRHFDRVNACAFSANGEYVATAGDDRTARVWHVATGAQLAHLYRPQAVYWAGFLPKDDAWLVLRYWDNYAEIVAWRGTDLVTLAGERLRRNLSPPEWRTYLEDEPYSATFPHLPTPADESHESRQ